MFLNKEKLNMNRQQLIQLIHLHSKTNRPIRKVMMTMIGTTVCSGSSNDDKRETNSDNRNKDVLSSSVNTGVLCLLSKPSACLKTQIYLAVSKTSKVFHVLSLEMMRAMLHTII
jgi:hypothetical protein